MKPKSNRKPGPMDNCQTPPYALDPLIPYLKSAKLHTIWEPAAGEGLLAAALRSHGFDVVDTDINDAYQHDFFEHDISGITDCIVTNPPYSLKYSWIEHCCLLGKQWALLMPVETIGAGTAHKLFDKHGVQIIYMRPRVDFLMPHALWAGKGAQFPVAWFTHGLNLPKDMVFAVLDKPKRSDLPEYWKAALGEQRYTRILARNFWGYIEYRVEVEYE